MPSPSSGCSAWTTAWARRRRGAPRGSQVRGAPGRPGARLGGGLPTRATGHRARQFAEPEAASRSIGAESSAAIARPVLLVDDPLELVDRAAVADGALQHPHLVEIEVGVAEQFVDQPPRARREALARDRHEQRALALAEVVARGLAGDLGVAVDAEQVVAQLERDAERQAESAERVELGRGTARDPRRRSRAAPRCCTWPT